MYKYKKYFIKVLNPQKKFYPLQNKIKNLQLVFIIRNKGFKSKICYI